MSITHKQTLYAFFAIIAVHLFFSSIIPPFQSPDELDHLKRAYLLSKGEIFMETPAGGSTGGEIDTGLNAYMIKHNKYAMKPQNKVTTEDLASAESVQWSYERRFGASPGVNYYFPLIYSPQALGLFLGQKIGLTVDKSYYLARFCVSFFIATILLLAFQIYSPSLFIVGLLIIPMTVFQFSSTSQDGMATALVILAASAFMRITTLPAPVSNKYFYLMAASILLITTSRINLLPMLGLLFIGAHYSIKRTENFILASLVVLLSLLWILYGLLTTVDDRMMLEHSTSEVILHYVKNPFEFFMVLGHTLSDRPLTHFYVDSFFGILGWLDTTMGEKNITALFYSTCLIFLFSISFSIFKKEYIARAALLATGIISILLLFFLLLITWNQHPATNISGVQGRYFLAPVILIGYGLTTSTLNLSRPQIAVGLCGLLVIMAITIFAMPRVLLERYYISANNKISAASPPSREFIDSKITIYSDTDDSVSEIGGYVDAVHIQANQLVIVGWGYFSDENHEFSSNSAVEIQGVHSAHHRPDVAEALSDPRLNYSGFRVTIDTKQSPVDIAELCLYSHDAIFGKKLIHPDSNKKPHKCGTRN